MSLLVNLSQSRRLFIRASVMVASLVFGILLFIAPVVGAVVLTWWIGAYAVAFGILLLILGFKLKGKKKASKPKKTPRTSSQPKPRQASKVVNKPPSPPAPRAASSAQTLSKHRAPAQSSGKALAWSWPAIGRVIRGYDPKSTGKKGVSIAGKTGQSVRAAAAGKVVYSGSGLSGYGRLIIIKHNKDFLSAYAHNRKLIAREGQWVEKGAVIAQMGSSGTDRPQLHFEIRKKGRPVDPLRYLPKR